MVKSLTFSKAHMSFHCLDFIDKNCFTVICQDSNIFDLKVNEVYFIKKCKPSLNTKYEIIKQNSASWVISSNYIEVTFKAEFCLSIYCI